MHGLIQEVLDSGLLRNYPDWFIAGGYAADPKLAGDIDVWIQVDDAEDLLNQHAALLRSLALAGFTFEAQNEGAAPEFGDVIEGEHVLTLKTAVVTSWRGIEFSKPVHLVLTTGTPADVLEGFDISTHQIALLPTGQYLYGTGWTPKDADPVILRDTDKTPERFVKIKHRYDGYRSGRSSVFTGV